MGTRPVLPSFGALSAVILATGLALSSQAQVTGPLQDLPLFNTGVDATGAPLAGGSVDPHYTLIASADPAFPGPNAIVATAIAQGYWIPNGPTSQWIAPSPNQDYPNTGPCNANGSYTYRTTLDLAGLDPATVTITGKWASDNTGAVLRVNGVSTGFVASSYAAYSNFVLSSGFVAGTNTIDFVVTDFGCPTGIRVEMSGTAEAAAAAMLSFAPTSLAFGSQRVGTTSAGQVATLTNAGSAPAGLLAPQITGDFSILATTCGASLAAGASCTITVAFAPTVAGQRDGTLGVFSDAGILGLGLVGSGTNVDLAPDPFSFPPRNNVRRLTTITSNAITPTGYAAAAPISVANGEYSIGCGIAFTAAAGTLAPGQSVCVRHTSDSKDQQEVATNLFIGGVSGAFRSTTASLDTIDQDIDFNLLGDRPVTTKPFTISARGGGSGNPVTFSSRSTPACMVSGSLVTLVSPGMCVIAANQDGNAQYSAAPEVIQSFLVNGEAQTITWPWLSFDNLEVGTTLTIVNATSSSNLAIAFTSLTPSVCTVNGSTATPIKGGICSIAANQAGNARFAPAAQVVSTSTVMEPLLGIAKIATGDLHSCALTTGGGVKCWGYNGYGQLGDNSTENHSGAIDVPDLTSGVTAISAGSGHTCALTAAGGVKCWGRNTEGQLGDSSVNQRLTPVDVFGLASGVKAISAGGLHTCAITTDGTVKCWGDNRSGQVNGDNAIGTYTSPASLLETAGLESDVTAISAGAQHTCAVTAGGAVKCWGESLHGKTGIRPALRYPLQQLSNGNAAVASGGEHSCALNAGGGVNCWGRLPAFSQAQDEVVYADYLLPNPISGAAAGVAAIAAGSSHTCLLTSGGGAKCWGSNSSAQLGFSTTLSAIVDIPGDVQGLTSGVAAISTGASHTCALKTGGRAVCWGSDNSGQLGAQGNGSRYNDAWGGWYSPTPYIDVQIENDYAPRPFSFIAQPGVFVGELRQSNAVVPRGFNQPTPISIVGGEYSVGCTASFTSAAGTIDAGQGVCVRHFASAAYSTSVTTILTIGGVSGAFTSTTATRPSLSLSVSSASFGNQPVGTTSAGQVVTLTNPGGHPTNGVVLGVNADFSISTSTCASILAPNSSCTITVTFTPLSLGGRTGDLQVFSTNSVPSTLQLPLFGTGTYSDFTPNAFSFIDQYLVPTNAVVTSAPVQITGLSSAASVSVIGGAYAVSSANNCAGDAQGFTANPGTISDGQFVCVRHTTSGVPGGSNDTQLIVGGLGDTFTTVTIDPVPAPFVFAPVVGVARSSTSVSAPAVITGINTASPVTVAGGEYSIGCTGAFTQSGSTILNGQSVCVRHVAAAAAATPTSTTLTVGGVAASFVTTTIPAAAIPRLGNISTRMQVLTGNDVMIGGFIIGGAQAKTVVVRARGPSLAPFGITNFLANPQLQLYSGQTVIASNDDWGTATNAAAIQSSGFAPFNAQEAAILTTLDPGAYTAIVSGVGGTTGVGIVEVFEVDLPEVPLANISTRGSVLTGNDVMIGGFIIQGDEPQTVVVRARGPSLADFGITNPLANPVLQLFSGQTQIAMNDNWQTDPSAATLQATGFAPASPFEAAIRITLTPGAYTAIVTGAGGTTGVAIIEVFAQ